MVTRYIRCLSAYPRQSTAVGELAYVVIRGVEAGFVGRVVRSDAHDSDMTIIQVGNRYFTGDECYVDPMPAGSTLTSEEDVELWSDRFPAQGELLGRSWSLAFSGQPDTVIPAIVVRNDARGSDPVTIFATIEEVPRHFFEGEMNEVSADDHQSATGSEGNRP